MLKRAKWSYLSAALSTTIFTISSLMAFQAHAQTSRNLNFSEACSQGDNIEIIAVGDILLHAPLQIQATTHSSRFESLWSGVLPYIKKADIAYANLEGPTALGLTANGRQVGDVGHRFDKNVYSGYPLFNYHPLLITDLKKSGFDIVSTSNNHSLDRGSLGADKTIEALKANNLLYAGTRTREETQNPDHQWYTITQSKGRNIAWVACTFSTNGVPDRHGQVMPCFQKQGELLGLVEKLSRNPQIHAVIVTPHWGDEYQLRHNNQQTQLGRQLIESGATAVLATHPHVVQPWEKVTTASGREGLIVYSTGNFVSNQAEVPRKTSIMVQLHLTGAPQSKLKIRGVSYLPLFMERTPLRTVRPVYNMSEVPAEAQQIWTNAFGAKNRISSATENQIQKYCANSQ
ncbi:CapA family protein [Pseudobdellovibrio exovorus]|uniref:Capsule synthesis protein CapA domain-containing protein n=1 Tax=Pseudobdellovibrio exovorus JSS TaxID=1184267 RepID=M4VRI5_9BACT|nr:CapA family protein [Pseudobdellovibrio exovorus]AGH95794.1 hypothetical protein A11Q_1578 [Pseudobdellovibrio exovorus JSS]